MLRHLARIVAGLALLNSIAPASADEVIFKNGDRLTGTIKSVSGGKLTIDSKVAGTVSVDLKDVQTFSTDASVQLKLNDKTMLRDKVAATNAPATQPIAGPANVSADGKSIAVTDI